MSKKIKKFLIILLVLVVVGVFAVPKIYHYLVYDYGKIDVKNSKDYSLLTTKGILEEFKSNEINTNKKYKGKIVAISGVVDSISGKTVFIDKVLKCEFSTIDSTIKKDQKISFKGLITGYEDLAKDMGMEGVLPTVSMQECSMIDKE